MTRFYRRLVVSLAWAGLLPPLIGAVALGDAVKPIPWLGGVTDSTVYASLEANSTTNATVDFGLTNAYGMSATTGSSGGYYESTGSGTYVHNVKLTGLLPNTQYHYRVTQGASVSADYTFWTAPQAGTAAHWGFTADSRTNIADHNSVAAQIATKAPKMMVYGGDLPNSGTYSSWNNEWFVANQNSLNATTPFVSSPGNHEGWNSLTKAFTQSATGDPDYFSFDYGDSHILVLNYMLADTAGSAQWNFAAADLAASTKKWKIVVDHSPAYCAGGHGEDPDMKALTTQVFEPNGVDLVLAGHSHFYQHNLVNRIQHMVIGSFGAPLATPSTAAYTVYSEQTYCYGIIDTAGDTLTLRTYRGLNSSPIETITLTSVNAWNVAGSGNWNVSGNWTGASGVPGMNGPGDTTTFGAVIGAATATISLNGASPSVKALTFDNTLGGKYVIARGSGGTLTLDNGTSAATVTVTNGSHEISAPVALSSNLAVSVANLANTLTLSGAVSGSGKSLSKDGPGTLALNVANSYTGGVSASAGTLALNHADAIPVPTATTGQDLYVGNGAKVVLGAGLTKAVQVRGLTMYGGTSPTGTVDLKNGQLVVDNTVTPVATIAAQIAAGYNVADPDNPWKGPGITSSTAAGDAAKYAVGYALNSDFGDLAWTTWFGRTVNNDSVLVRFTYNGDADLNGETATDDFDQWKQGYVTHLAGWFHGDFDYSGDITTDDFDLWKQVYVGHYTPLGDGSGGGSAAGSPVPEPGVLTLLGIAAVGLTARALRRRPTSTARCRNCRRSSSGLDTCS